MRSRFLVVAAQTAAAIFLSLPACPAADVPGTVKWVFKACGPVYSSPTIGAGGTIYVREANTLNNESIPSSLYALDGKTGRKKWAFTTGVAVDSFPAIATDGTAYVGSMDGNVYALNGQTGHRKWAFKTEAGVLEGFGSGVSASPAIGSDGTVYVGSLNHNVYALDAKTGVKKWVLNTTNPVVSSPTIGPDGTIYVGSGSGRSGGNVFALYGNGAGALQPGERRSAAGAGAQHTGRR